MSSDEAASQRSREHTHCLPLEKTVGITQQSSPPEPGQQRDSKQPLQPHRGLKPRATKSLSYTLKLWLVQEVSLQEREMVGGTAATMRLFSSKTSLHSSGRGSIGHGATRDCGTKHTLPLMEVPPKSCT